MSVREQTTTHTTAQSAASKLSRERRLDRVRPGWWVFSYGPTDLGSFGKATAVTTFTDPANGRALVRLTITDPHGRRVEVENAAGHPAWCLTAADARRAGLA
jgi:hypothetical protein